MWLVLHAKGICFKDDRNEQDGSPIQPSNQISSILQDLATSFLPPETSPPLPLVMAPD